MRRVLITEILVLDIYEWEGEGYLRTHSVDVINAHADNATRQDPLCGVLHMRVLVLDLYDRGEI